VDTFALWSCIEVHFESTLHQLFGGFQIQFEQKSDCKTTEDSATFPEVPDECDKQIVLTFEQLSIHRTEDDIEETDGLLLVQQMPSNIVTMLITYHLE
jgi:hypothetical protein